MSKRRDPKFFDENGNPRPPYSRDGRRERFQVILAAEDLEAYTHVKARDTDIFPKRERTGLALKMENEATDAYRFLASANDMDLRIPSERETRLMLQQRGLTELKLLNHHIEYLYARHRIGKSVFAYWTALVDSCKNQAAAWHSSDKERAANHDKRDRTNDLNLIARVLDEMRRTRRGQGQG